jgi:phospholipid-transporting ATPase
MLKDFLENCKRTNADAQENNSPILILQDGKFMPTTWANLRTGDVIKVLRGDFIPADILLLFSSSDKQDCYVETKNLDGETNLKMKCVPEAFRDQVKFEKDILKLNGCRFSFEEPNPYLYTFNGVVTLEPSKSLVPIEPKHFLLRGSHLRNTQFIIGVVAFNGQFTKVMMNSIKSKPKRSYLESKMGWQILLVFILLVL